SDKSITNIFDKIDAVLQKQHRKRVDFIVGGPPCQAFSMLNRHNANIADDKRCLLYLQYGKFLKKYKPMGFVFENVLGLLSSKKNHFENIKAHFKELGYKVHYVILNAADYGAMQNRQRVIIFGWRKTRDRGCPEITKMENPWTCADLFSDLPQINAGEMSSAYNTEPTDYLREFGLRSDDDVLTLHMARPLNNVDAEKYRMAVQMWLENGIRIKNSDFPDEIRTINNTTSFLDRFKVVDLNGKCHTVVAHIAKDGHYYIYPSTQTVRSISVREAARIQSFPDNFFFEGSRSAMFKQIGNAVPPLMAYAIAKSIKELLCPKTI
ncbi:MAG: DNA cytosine methyltransferase, partial [Bacteroidales bacterium]|nr:DNA cytosine methyltransferase [Bacteroidales bacterium]